MPVDVDALYVFFCFRELASHRKIKTMMTCFHVTDQHKKDATAALSQLGY